MSTSPEIKPLDFTDNSPAVSPTSRFERSVSPSASTSSYESLASTAATSVTGEDFNEKLAAAASKHSQQELLSEGITPESLSNHKDYKKKKDGSLKKNPNKTSSRISSATGISSAVPVTGERPRPTQHPSLEDNVFFTIFQILHDHDPDTKGMTVKQICDVLGDQHPEMAKLSTKTSNLVSAKLNAYVKRVEKGERDIIYALSRDWADASPKRMVYVYRGLLTPDYYITAKSLWEKLELEGTLFPDRSKDEEKKMKKEEKKLLAAAAASGSGSETPISGSLTPSMDEFSKDVSTKQRRATMFDLRTRPALTTSFTDNALDLRTPNLSIPYEVAPVTAALGNLVADEAASSSSSSLSSNTSHHHQLSKPKPLLKTRDEFELDDEFDSLYDNDDFNTITTDLIRFRDASKRSKSMSFIPNKKGKYITALALAPRVPRQPQPMSPSQQAQLAALHAAVIKDFNATQMEIDNSSDDEAESVSGDFKQLSMDGQRKKRVSSFVADVSVSAKWLETVRAGFLTQEIGIPEEVSLSELDSMFT